MKTIQSNIKPAREARLQTEGDRIREAANKIRDQFPEIAKRYDDLALSHDLKDARESK